MTAAPAKTLTRLRAYPQSDDRNRTTGGVELAALPEWLKSGRFVTATLTPQQARALAIDLLRAAELAEGNRP